MTTDQVTPEANATGNQDQFSLGWRAALPTEFKEHDLVKTHQKPGDFVKWAIETKTSHDTLKSQLDNSIPKLPENATDEQRAQFYTAIGRPDKPEGYEIKAEGLDEGFVKWARESFFKHGTPKGVAEGMINEYIAYQQKVVEDYEKQRQATISDSLTKLKAELGDKFAENCEMVKRVWSKHVGEDYDKFIAETGIGEDPRLLKLVINLAKLTGEDNSPSGSQKKDETKQSGWSYPNSPEPPARSGY